MALSNDPQPERIHPAWQPGRQCLLLACVLALFVVHPLADDQLPNFSLLLDLFLFLIMAVTAWTFVSQRGVFIVLLVCLVLSYALIWGMAWLFPAGRRSFRLGLNVIAHARSGDELDG